MTRFNHSSLSILKAENLIKCMHIAIDQLEIQY